MKSKAAETAHKAFQATLREKGCRLDQAQIDKAWEAAVAAAWDVYAKGVFPVWSDGEPKPLP